ncbi:MAG: hypothetical protein JKX81_05545 [Arenicella sp.]|nr:hypothetical protein [Arenicella sp.]
MNNENTYKADQDPLDALFASARQAQPNLIDHSFTKILVNSLPKVNFMAQKERARKGLSFDLIGAVIGLLMAYLFIDQTSLVSSFIGLIPESLVISPLLVISAIAAVGFSSIVAWWMVEDDSF